MKLCVFVLLGLSSLILSSCSNTGEIRGKINYTTGSYASNANVFTEPPSSSVFTNPQGEYAIAELQPGDYTVFAVESEYFADTISKTIHVDKAGITTCDMSFKVLKTLK